MILSQLVDAEEYEGLSPEELREMLLKLDDEILFGDEEEEAEAEVSAEASPEEPATDAPERLLQRQARR